ncbi:hypothetical protein Tco_1120639 [Tanacetum coccineum]
MVQVPITELVIISLNLRYDPFDNYCYREKTTARMETHLYDGIIIMLEFVACSIPSCFGEVQLRLHPFVLNQEEDRDDDLAPGEKNREEKLVSEVFKLVTGYRDHERHVAGLDIDLDLNFSFSVRPVNTDFVYIILWTLLHLEAKVQGHRIMEEEEVAETKKTLMLLKYLEYETYLLEEVEVVGMRPCFSVRYVFFVNGGDPGGCSWFTSRFAFVSFYELPH